MLFHGGQREFIVGFHARAGSTQAITGEEGWEWGRGTLKLVMVSLIFQETTSFHLYSGEQEVCWVLLYAPVILGYGRMYNSNLG